MHQSHTLVPRVGIVAVAFAAIQIGCQEAPTDPDSRSVRVPNAAATINSPGDSASREIIFLAPLGPRKHPRGVLDTALAPTVVICRLAGSSCGADTLARFRSDASLADSSRVSVDSSAYSVRWNTSEIPADPSAAFRVIVALGDTTAGSTDLKIVAAGFQSAAADTALFAFVSRRKALTVRFQIFVPPDSLTVVVEPGVRGSPASGTYAYRRGTRVPYGYTADSGYTNVLVTLDEKYIPRQGRVDMTRSHVLVVSADRIPSVAPRDEWIVRDERALLHAANPVLAAQKLLDRLDSLSDTARLTDRLKNAEHVTLSRERDPERLRSLDAALAGHVFHVRSGRGKPDSIPPQTPPPSPPGGPILTTLLVPQHAARIAPSAAVMGPVMTSASLSPPRILSQEPLTVAHVNGVTTTPLEALTSIAALAPVLRGADWKADVNFDLRLIYNRTAGITSSDALERCLVEIAAKGDLLGLNSVPKEIASCASLSTAQVTAMLGDFVEAGVELSAILARSRDVRPADVETLAAITSKWRDSGRHVIFVPHSQGNMIVQQGVDILRSSGRYKPGTDTTCIGAVAVAAPTSANWPISDRHLHGIVVEHDAILALHMNHFPQLRTSLSDSVGRKLASVPLSRVPVLGAIARLREGTKAHAFVESYLKHAETVKAIQDGAAHAYRSCAVGDVVAQPEGMRLRTGETRSFSARFRDMNGEPLDGTRGVRWSAVTGGGLTDAVALSADGTARARWVGGTSVRLETKSRWNTTGVDVDPAQLGVTTRESLSARWVLIDGMLELPKDPMGPDPHHLPEFPVPWDGGSCTAKTTIVWEGRTGQFSLQCSAVYTVAADPFAGAERYQAVFSEVGLGPSYTDTKPTGSLSLRVSGPNAIWERMPGPKLIDRINVSAWDAASHLLASGHACMHGCVGWPPDR